MSTVIFGNYYVEMTPREEGSLHREKCSNEGCTVCVTQLVEFKLYRKEHQGAGGLIAEFAVLEDSSSDVLYAIQEIVKNL